MGGDVEAGLALSEMISTLSKPTVSLVLGGGTQYRDTLGNGNGLFIYSRDRYDDSASDTDDRSCNNC